MHINFLFPPVFYTQALEPKKQRAALFNIWGKLSHVYKYMYVYICKYIPKHNKSPLFSPLFRPAGARA